jgi:uncharacterized protein YdhG (YjbR/CyaY superfamily)
MNQKNTPKDVDSYLAALPPDSRKALENIRKIVKSIAPDAEEIISYQMPGYRLNGRPLIYFAAFKDHLSIFPGGYIADKYAADLKGFKTKKGTIQFTVEKPLPADLLKKIVKDKVEEIELKTRSTKVKK